MTTAGCHGMVAGMTTNEATKPAPTTLSDAQQSRVEALQAARAVLVARGPISSSAADAGNLIRVAHYIERGAIDVP